MALAVGARLGPYEILAPLGAGGMGEVYRARDTRLDRTVAIKILPEALAADPEFRARFEREARTISRLGHPNICALFDIGRENGIDFLVLEHLDGETLHDRLARTKGGLPIAEALTFAIEICEALGRAHRAGIVHRDLKPGNVMLARGVGSRAAAAHVKLLDFGLAAERSVTGSGDPTARTAVPTVSVGPPLTAKGTIIGTYQYMAPEQLEGRPADTRSDVFAFGAVLYEMFTGRKAFDGATAASIIGAVMHADPPPVSTLQPVSPPAVDRLVSTCLAKDPDERWQDIRDLERELRWIADSIASARVGMDDRARRARASFAWVAPAVAAVAVVVAASLAIALILRWRASDPTPAWARGVIRLSVDMPGNADPSSTPAGNNPPIVSPDGRAVTWVAENREFRARLWVRSFDTADARELAGTDGAGYPFWSPDGRSIGFFAGGGLKRVAVASGTVQSLATTSTVSLGGAWSRDNVIVFSSRFGLYQIPASGGAPKIVAELDRSRQENSLRFPQFLPDGRHFLYVARSGRPDRNAAYVGSLDGKPTLLFPTLSNVMYAPTGYILFVRDGRLIARRFDADTLKTSGDTITLAEHVGGSTLSVVGHFSVSENGVVAYSGGVDAKSTLRWFDRSGRPLDAIGDPVAITRFCLSPDGRRVAAALNDFSAGTRSLWILEAGHPSVRLTFAGTHDWEPVWSPDGSRIAFGSYRDGPLNIYVKSVTGGGGDEPLIISDEQKDTGDWSADGRWFAYVLNRGAATRSDVWVMPLTGDRKPIPIAATEAQESAPRFSPDGRWIAYQSDETGRNEVYVQPFPPTGGKWQVSTGGGAEPAWRRDGRELFYVAPGPTLMAVGVNVGASFSTGTPSSLFRLGRPSAVATTTYDVAPDGQRFLVSVPVPAAAPTQISVIFNWPTLLKTR